MNKAVSVIDEASRKKFESDWRLGRASSIDAYLPSDESIQYLPTLEELVCIEMEFLWDKEAKGTSVTPDAATIDDVSSRPTYVEDYTSRFAALRAPDVVARLAEHEAEVRRGTKKPPTQAEFRRRFPKLEFAPRLFASSSSSSSIRSGKSFQINEKDLPRWFGKFQLTAVLGRGGMATVYRGTQHNTDRDVAVKIADPLTAPGRSEEFKRRFMAEAKAAAGLRHDNIVPVYDVGEVNGQPYYTMPIINGGDLAEKLADGPLSSHESAQRVKDAAEGVAAAHQNGVLHRDLKPRNLMIDNEKDRTMVADFGLAREITSGDVGLAGDANEQLIQLTRTGQVLGTPPYMAPEQIRDARSADARSDVYSLGATLYQSLTGRPPFQAATPTETLLQVLESEVVPPRQLNVAVNRDLETIVLKSLEKEPSKRYLNAREFVDDLGRYLNGEPIRARRIGPIGRLGKWCKRNKRAAVLSSLLLLAVFMAIGATIGGLAAVAREATKTAEQATLATGNLVKYSDVLDDMFLDASDDPRYSDQPGETAARQKWVKKSIKHYLTIVQLAADNPDLQAKLIRAHVQLGALTRENDGPAAGLEHYRKAIAVYDGLDAQLRMDRRIDITLSDAHNGMGRCLASLGDSQAAHHAFETAERMRGKIVETAPPEGEVEAKRKHANAQMNLGLAKARLLQRDASLALMKRAQRSRQRLLNDHPDEVLVQRDTGHGAYGLASFYANNAEPDVAKQYIDKALSAYQGFSRTRPNDGSNWMRIARCRLLAATIALEQGDKAAGDAELKIADELLTQFDTLADYNVSYRIEVANHYLQGTRSLILSQQWDQARRTNESTSKFLDHDLTNKEQGERSLDVMRIRLIHQSQSLIIQMGAALIEKERAATPVEEQAALGQIKTAKDGITILMKTWADVQSRFTNDRELNEEMEDLMTFIQNDSV